jgi:hypothetical protein
MMIHYHITATAMQTAHSLPGWHTVWNLLLQKDPKSVRIDKNRTIMIMEADRNFILKWTTAKKLMQYAEKQGTIADEQFGGRQGHCAIDGAILKTMEYEIIRMLHMLEGNFEADARACFDRMIENMTNMCLRAQGMPDQNLLLHARTQQNIRYHILTHHGVSKQHNQHTEETPWHGSAQGRGDSANRWDFISSDMIEAYKSQAHLWELKNPDGSATIVIGLQAFIDDTNSILALPHGSQTQELQEKLQHNADLWNGLLHATGGKLNAEKCSLTIFKWDQELGKAVLENP